jgi:hypothetical protein
MYASEPYMYSLIFIFSFFFQLNSSSSLPRTWVGSFILIALFDFVAGKQLIVIFASALFLGHLSEGLHIDLGGLYKGLFETCFILGNTISIWMNMVRWKSVNMSIRVSNEIKVVIELKSYMKGCFVFANSFCLLAITP